MPKLLPFRALRFSAAAGDLSDVLAPPYDIISPDERRALLAQDPHNAVRIDLPADLGHAEASDYATAARTVETWRRDGILVKDAEPTLTIHEMSWSGDDGERLRATGFFARLRLEEYGTGAGVLPHERTFGGPKQDRYDLIDATESNTSPLVFLAGSDHAAVSQQLSRLSDRPADAEALTTDGVGHRLWICQAADEGVSALLDLVSAVPITIADGHHRYETALTFRNDRRAANPDTVDPAWDFVMALIYPLDQAPPALPTHRIVSGGPVGADLVERVGRFGTVEAVAGRDELLGHMAEAVVFAPGATGTGRFGLYSAGTTALINVDQAKISASLDAQLSEASKGLDANALTAMIESIYGADPNALMAAGRLTYEKDAATAMQRVTEGAADTCFLLDLMPASAISSVAEAGEVMPQKSTYFNPKAPTGLLFSPLEW